MTDHIFRRGGASIAKAGNGRFEYRVWPRAQPWAAARLQSGWVLESGESRADIYLVTPFSAETLVKLRDGARLEIKLRGPDMDILQYWSCPVSAAFPLSRATLAAVARALGLTLGLTGQLRPEATLSPAHLVADIAAFAPLVRPVTMAKSRLIFRDGSCRAELCRVGEPGCSRVTIAIEDPDPVSALSAIDALGISGLTNLSYGDILRPHQVTQAGVAQ